MTALIMTEPRQRYYNNDGTVAAGCYLYTYAAGTTTPKAAYTDYAGTIPHANPIVLDSKGEALIYWSGSYKVDLKTAAGVQITGYPVDNFVSDALTTAQVQALIDAAVNPLSVTRNACVNGGMRVASNPVLTLTTAFLEGKVNKLFGRVTNVSAGTLTQGNSTSYVSNAYAHFSGVTTSGTSVTEAQIRIPAGEAARFVNAASVFSCLVYHDIGSSKNVTITIKTPTTTADDFSALTTISTGTATAIATGADTRMTLAVADMADCSKGIAIEISLANTSVMTTKNIRVTEAQFETGTTRTSFVETIYEAAKAGVSPTMPAGTNTTDLATTEFVQTARTGSIIGRAYGEYSDYQRVSSVIPIYDTVPTSSEGTEIISVSYTPTSASNTIRLTGTVGGLPSVTGASVSLFNGTTCVDAKIFAHSSIYGSTALVVEFTAGTTSSTAYSMRVGVDPAGYVDINGTFAGARAFGGKSLCTLVVEEIKV